MLRQLLIAALSAAGCGSALAEKPTLVVLSSPEVRLESLVFDTFEKKCGCKVVVEYSKALDRIAKLEARKENPIVDVVTLNDGAAIEAAEKGLISTIDVDKLTNYEKLHDFAKDPIGHRRSVAYTIAATGIVYRKDKISEITSWQDLFRPDLKGRIALPDLATDGQGAITLAMIDRAFGGTDDEFSVAFDRLGKSKDHVRVFYRQARDTIALFQQEEIWAAPVGRFVWHNLVRLNKELAWAVPREGQAGLMNTLALTNRQENRELAHQFIDHWLSVEVQTATALAGIDSPSNKEVVLPEDKASFLTYGHDQISSLKPLPPDFLLHNRAAWLARWNRMIASQN